MLRATAGILVVSVLFVCWTPAVTSRHLRKFDLLYVVLGLRIRVTLNVSSHTLVNTKVPNHLVLMLTSSNAMQRVLRMQRRRE